MPGSGEFRRFLADSVEHRQKVTAYLPRLYSSFGGRVSTGEKSAHRAELSAEQTSLFILLVACVAHYWICLTLTSEIALDVDPINLLYGMHEFNIAHHAPHPPGYWVYVWMLRGLHAVVGGDPFASVQLLARLMSTATIPLIYLAVRLLRPSDAFAAGFAAILAAFHPFLIFHGVDAQTHTSEAFAAALLLVVVVCYRRHPAIGWAAASGAALALGSAFRPSFIVAGIGPIVWAIGFRRFLHLSVAGAVSIVGALAWVLPTFEASGGREQWRAAHDALVEQTFVRTSSPFSGEAIMEFVLYSVLSTAFWLLLALAPAIVAMLARRGSLNPPDDAYRDARAIAFWSAAPSVVFYLSMFCSEPGYLLGFIPMVIAATALAATPDLPNKTRRLTLALAALTQLAILMMPGAFNYVGKVPSIPELVHREVVYRTVLERMAEKIPPDARILYVTDYPDIVLSRQLPVLHPKLHAMIIHSEYWPGFDDTCIGYATQDDWIPIPGPILLQPGPETIAEMPYVYDFVVVDPLSSPDLRDELRRHTRCDVGSIEDADAEVPVLPARECFTNAVIEVHGQGVRFQLPEG